MAFYKVTCYSNCGSYFSTYLRTVTVRAEDKEQVKQQVKKWLALNGRKFIYPEDKWEVFELVEEGSCGVIDYEEDSDY